MWAHTEELTLQHNHLLCLQALLAISGVIPSFDAPRRLLGSCPVLAPFHRGLSKRSSLKNTWIYGSCCRRPGRSKRRAPAATLSARDAAWSLTSTFGRSASPRWWLSWQRHSRPRHRIISGPSQRLAGPSSAQPGCPMTWPSAANRGSLDWGHVDAALYNEAFAGRAKQIPRCRYCLADTHFPGVPARSGGRHGGPHPDGEPLSTARPAVGGGRPRRVCRRYLPPVQLPGGLQVPLRAVPLRPPVHLPAPSGGVWREATADT